VPTRHLPTETVGNELQLVVRQRFIQSFDKLVCVIGVGWSVVDATFEEKAIVIPEQEWVALQPIALLLNLAIGFPPPLLGRKEKCGVQNATLF